MMKQFFVGVIISLSIFNNASAQEVTVTGMGVDKDSAIRDATRNAVENIVGVYISSRALSRDSELVLDEIYTKSQGYVKRIQILDESQLDSSTYRVTAKIDVDTSPNSKLIDEVTMLMRLNDPRIAVIIFEDELSRNESAESILIDKLLNMNFSHVLHPSQVIKQNDAELLNNIVSGEKGLFQGKKDNVTDYLVVGKCTRISNPVQVSEYTVSGGMIDSPLKCVRSSFKVDVIKYDTGEYIGTFLAEGKGIGNTDGTAQKTADNVALNIAAEKLGDTFKKFSAKSSNGLTFTITANTESKLDQILEELRSIGTIDNIQIREQEGSRVVLSIETSNRPHEVVTLLKSQTRLGVFVENMSASGCKLRIT